ncbi:MAG TPA: hypothetical protein PK706_02680 [Xanthobacteraceae bacterium]|nr:hypothetical protein [Xanthobacteraceae bacterium]
MEQAAQPHDGRIKAHTLRGGRGIVFPIYLTNIDTLRRLTAMCGLHGNLVG